MNHSEQVNSQRLARFIQRHLPLVCEMGLEIVDYNGEQLVVQAPLAKNHNDKGTAFGGSLYNLCISNAIGLLFIKCFEQGLNPDLVVAKAEIEYLLPVTHDPIVSQSLSPSDELWQAFFSRYNERGKASIELQAIVASGTQNAVIFTGRFALIGESDTSI